MRSMKCVATALVAATVLGSAAWASTGHGDGGHNAAGHPGDPKLVGRTVRLEASEIKFDARHLSFKVGETVKFIVVNKGEQDHELAIGDSATQLAHRQAMQESASATGHAHGATSAVTVKPGETKELIWQFSSPGSFEFACNFPGHAEAGMAGTISVR